MILLALTDWNISIVSCKLVVYVYLINTCASACRALCSAESNTLMCSHQYLLPSAHARYFAECSFADAAQLLPVERVQLSSSSRPDQSQTLSQTGHLLLLC